MLLGNGIIKLKIAETRNILLILNILFQELETTLFIVGIQTLTVCDILDLEGCFSLSLFLTTKKKNTCCYGLRCHRI